MSDVRWLAYELIASSTKANEPKRPLSKTQRQVRWIALISVSLLAFLQ